MLLHDCVLFPYSTAIGHFSCNAWLGDIINNSVRTVFYTSLGVHYIYFCWERSMCVCVCVCVCV
jgi:hypothetical protein